MPRLGATPSAITIVSEATLVVIPTPDGAVRLVFTDDGMNFLPAVVGVLVDFMASALAAVIAVTSIGTVEPHFKNRAVVRSYLVDLLVKGSDIAGAAVFGMIAIPWGNIDGEFETRFFAGFGHFLHHVALAVLVWRGGNVVRGAFGRPQAEAVMVLGHEDESFHAAGLGCGGDLVGVERRGVEDRRIFIAETPLAIREGVHGEVDERIQFQFMPAHLAVGGHRAECFGRSRGRCGE